MKTNHKHNPSLRYLRSLIYEKGHTQTSAAAEIGISPRALRRYLSLDADEYREAPYPVQLALERLSHVRKPTRIGRPPAIIPAPPAQRTVRR